MSRSYYTRAQIVETLEIDAEFLVSLEREAIVTCDAPSGAEGEFSERMLERARVAHNLTHELDVNLARRSHHRSHARADAAATAAHRAIPGRARAAVRLACCPDRPLP